MKGNGVVCLHQDMYYFITYSSLVMDVRIMMMIMTHASALSDIDWSSCGCSLLSPPLESSLPPVVIRSYSYAVAPSSLRHCFSLLDDSTCLTNKESLLHPLSFTALLHHTTCQTRLTLLHPVLNLSRHLHLLRCLTCFPFLPYCFSLHPTLLYLV